MALAFEDKREEVSLPGELPPGFGRLHRHHHQAKLATAQHSLCSISADGLAADVPPKGLQENQQKECDDSDGALFKVIDRLDDIVERLMKSCKVKPNIELQTDAGAPAEEPFNSRVLEDRLDKIIRVLSQSGHFSRLSKELYMTPPKVNFVNSKPLCYDSPESPLRKSPIGTMSAKAHDDDQRSNPVTPTSSFRIPLLTPRSLLSKFGSSEKVDASASPTTTRRLSSGRRSGRFSAAFSFLTSPRRAGSTSSFRIGSPKPSDGYLER